MDLPWVTLFWLSNVYKYWCICAFSWKIFEWLQYTSTKCDGCNMIRPGAPEELQSSPVWPVLPAIASITSITSITAKPLLFGWDSRTTWLGHPLQVGMGDDYLSWMLRWHRVWLRTSFFVRSFFGLPLGGFGQYWYLFSVHISRWLIVSFWKFLTAFDTFPSEHDKSYGQCGSGLTWCHDQNDGLLPETSRVSNNPPFFETEGMPIDHSYCFQDDCWVASWQSLEAHSILAVSGRSLGPIVSSGLMTPEDPQMHSESRSEWSDWIEWSE